MSKFRIVSWNVNGIRASLKKGFEDKANAFEADVLGLQEIKCQENTLPEINIALPYRYYNYADKKGYSGTALLCRTEPDNVTYDFPGHMGEGRVITGDFGTHYVVNVYVPNSGEGLRRLDYRSKEWDRDFRGYLCELAQSKPVAACGDFNVAHKEIDIARPAANHFTAGFTDEERAGMDAFLEAGFIDSFRHLYPDTKDAYSWWSFRANARAKNIGWRIDYVLVSEAARNWIKDAWISPDTMGSDHCPVGVDLELP